MRTLFDNSTMDRGAQFSGCRNYRYSLWRVWNDDLPALMFIGLNPSTADENEDDPTIRRCIGFAELLGYGGVLMLNLYAWRSTDPKELKKAVNPVGRENNTYIRMYHESAGRTIACWGANVFGGRDLDVCDLPRPPYPLAKTQTIGDDLWCFGTTKDGHPRHPLYLPAQTTISKFRVNRPPM